MEISEEELIKIQGITEKLKQSKFKQQTLYVWRPMPTLNQAIVVFGFFGVLLAALGVSMIYFSDKISFAMIGYEGSEQNQCGTPKSICHQNGVLIDCDPSKRNESLVISNECIIKLELDTEFEAPTYLYYRLEDFF